MRIVGGKFRGKKILQPKDKETRPLKDLAKESIFNIIEHSNKLDAFLSKNKKVYKAKSVKKNNFNYQDFISIFKKNILMV